MEWYELKSRLLEKGFARLTGAPWEKVARSTAGPGAGGEGSVFFSFEGRRVRLSVNPKGAVEIYHLGEGKAKIVLGDEVVTGMLEPAPLHCPGQAFITVTAGCKYHCRYCNVPLSEPKRKSIEEIVALVESAKDTVYAISLTSGVLISPEEEEEYVCSVIEHLSSFKLPIGVSIYPTKNSAKKLYRRGVTEVKWNLETATDALFSILCPDLKRETIWQALKDSVPLFGRGRVFSNVIIGVGETDEELNSCINKLTGSGIIPVLRPINPVAELKGYERPSSERLLQIFKAHKEALQKAGLDPGLAQTMCIRCTGCDLVPGRDR